LKKHGLGILIESDHGKRYEGEFEDDIAIGNGKIIYPNGDVYTGKVDKLTKQGPGKLIYS
jgi:hypothetical protein